MPPEDANSPAPLSARAAAVLSVRRLLRDGSVDPICESFARLQYGPGVTKPAQGVYFQGSILPGDLHDPLRSPILPLAPHPPLSDHLEGCTLRHPRPHPLRYLLRHFHHHCHNLHSLHARSRVTLRSATPAGLVPDLDPRHHSSPRPYCPPLLRPYVREGCCRVAMERLDSRPESS